MKLREHEYIDNGKWRKARKLHKCESVHYFGVQPHANCKGVISPKQKYWDTGVADEPYHTYKICVFCADMELTEPLSFEARNQLKESIKNTFNKLKESE